MSEINEKCKLTLEKASNPQTKSTHPRPPLSDYIAHAHLSGSIFSAGRVESWAATHEICNPSAPVAEREFTHTPRRYTNYWIHLPDPIHQPTTIDGLFRGSPPSSLFMRPPDERGTAIDRVGASYPLMQEGREYFYMQGERRIDLPNIRSQYPQLR